MRLLKMMLIVSLVLALFQPAMLVSVASAAGSLLTRTANAAQSTYKDEGARTQACLLFSRWEAMDSGSRNAGAAAVSMLAREQAKHTDDAAVLALLAVIPDAVGAGNRARTRTARALLSRECGNGS